MEIVSRSKKLKIEKFGIKLQKCDFIFASFARINKLSPLVETVNLVRNLK